MDIFMNILLGVVASVVFAAMTYCLNKLRVWYFYYRNSKYSGTWVDEIYDTEAFKERNERIVVKRDEYTLVHNKRTNRVVGTVRRVFPMDQSYREWKLTGVIQNQTLIFTFWADDAIKSHGCVYACLTDDYTFEGFYLGEHKTAGVIDETPIKLRKDNTVKRK